LLNKVQQFDNILCYDKVEDSVIFDEFGKPRIPKQAFSFIIPSLKFEGFVFACIQLET